MYKIITKKINNSLCTMRVIAPEIAMSRKPGQFVIVIPTEKSERIPLTIVDSDKDTILLYFQILGTTTLRLSTLSEGDTIYSITGPLGMPTEIKYFGKLLCIGGGVGLAPLYPIVRGLREKGNFIHFIAGARTKDLLILEDEFRDICNLYTPITDDGSYGKKGLVTDAEREILQKEKVDKIFTVGPVIMMKNVVLVAEEFGVPSVVSLNPIMVDGTGMCGCCRVKIGDKTKFACVDGPEFEGSKVDFDDLIIRLNSYKKEEQHSYILCQAENKQGK